MAKDKITEYDATAANNTDVGGVNLAENSMNPSDVNNAIREVMSHQKEAFGSGTPLFVDQTNNRVGINNSSPAVALDVTGNVVVSKATPNVDIKDTGTAQASMDFLSNSDTVRATIGMERSAGGGLFVGSSAYSAVFGTASSGNTEFATNNNIRMAIDSSGNVGIGATSISNGKLVLLGSNGTIGGVSGLARFAKNGSGGGAIESGDDNAQIQIGSDGTNGFISTGNNDIRILTNAGERMRIHSGGVTSFATTNTNPAENNVAGTSILTTGAISASADGNFGIQINRKSSFGGVIHLRKDGSGGGFLAIFEDSSAGRLLLGNDNTCLLFNDSTKQIIPFQSTGAKQDDIIALGNASGRFDQVFSANGSLNTSDKNEKQDIEELTDAEKRVAVKAKSLVRKYRWKKRVTEKGDNARTHIGIIAQDLQDAFTAEGLDATKYGMFCSDTWWDNDEVFVDDDGKEHNIVKSYYTEEEAPEGSTKRTRLAVRYSELLAFIISAI